MTFKWTIDEYSEMKLVLFTLFQFNSCSNVTFLSCGKIVEKKTVLHALMPDLITNTC